MSPWRFQIAEKRLVRGNDIVQLTPRAASVLELLIRHKGEVLSHEFILQNVWKEVTVTRDLVREYVFDIRKALGDHAKNPVYIETIKGVGFRLLGGISFEPSSLSSKYSLVLPKIAVWEPVVHDESGDHTIMAKKFAADMIHCLAKYPYLHIYGVESAIFAQTETPAEATDLHMDYVVATEVYSSNGKTAVFVRLIDMHDRHVIWSFREHISLFGIWRELSEIVDLIVDVLASEIGVIQRADFNRSKHLSTDKLDAYQHFLRGIFEIRSKMDMENAQRKALEHMNAAIRLSPDFAPAWHYKMMICDFIAMHFAREAERHKLLKQAEQAIAQAHWLSPRDPGILLQAARVDARLGNKLEAENRLQIAYDVGRRQADAAAIFTSYASCFGSVGQSTIDEAIRTARTLNPITPASYEVREAIAAYCFGNIERCLRLTQDKIHLGLLFNALAKLRCGRINDAVESFRKMQLNFPGFDRESSLSYVPLLRKGPAETFAKDIDFLYDQT